MMTRGKSLAGLLFLAIGVGACSSEEPLDPTPGETKVVYSCDGGRSFSATFIVGRESVLFEADGKSLELVQIPAQNGVAYSNGQMIFHAEEGSAFTEGYSGGDFTTCTGSNT